MARATYKDAGVDLDVYRQAMARLPRLLARTYTPRVLPLGGGVCRPFPARFQQPPVRRRYEDPVLVACSDGVGTKLKVAVAAGVHNTVGIDLVAMSVNDALCCGAEPLFFLDYVAMPKDDPALAGAARRGRGQRLHRSRLRLAGRRDGHPARPLRPGRLRPGGLLRGRGVAKAAHRRLGHRARRPGPGPGLDRPALQRLQPGAGRSSSRSPAWGSSDLVEELGATVGQALLEPTRIYVRAVRQVLGHYRVKNVVHGIAHITGGGLAENLARIVPAGVQIVIDRGSWPVPPVFPWLQRLGEVEEAEMDQVFNMGLGLVLVVSPFYAESIRSQLARLGIAAWLIGRAEAGPQGVVAAK